MRRVSGILFGAALLVLAGSALSQAYAQTGGRALFAYPLRGQTLEQQNADRAACHQWAVEQTGYDPSAVFLAQQAGVPIRTITDVTRRMTTPSAGGFGSARGNAEVRRLNALYDNYLRAGQVCLEGRGYRVTR
jgi:hypothetical protein